jgi:hypothetical protein
MLRSGAPDAGEPALLALLNLAVRDERCATLHPSLSLLQYSHKVTIFFFFA